MKLIVKRSTLHYRDNFFNLSIYLCNLCKWLFTNIFVAFFVVNFSTAIAEGGYGSRDRAVNGDMRSYSVECQNMNMVVAQEEGRGTSVSWSEPVTPRYVHTRVNVRAFVRTAHTQAAALPRIIPCPTLPSIFRL